MAEPEYPAQQVADIITDALRGHRVRRHPAEVVSDRLGDIVTKHRDRFDPAELDMVATIRHRLETIAEENGHA